MFSIKTLASTVAAAGLVSVIGLAYAQTDPRIESPSNHGNTSMPNSGTSTQGDTNAQGDTNMPNSSTSMQGTTATPANRTGTQGSTMSSDTNLRADGSSELEPRADRN